MPELNPTFSPSFAMPPHPNKENFSPEVTSPFLHPDALRGHRPDVVLILPWNIAEEVVQKNKFVQEWGGKFVVAVPEIKIIEVTQ